MPETILDIKSIEIGTDISFKTINPLDNTLYEGKMIGKGNYDEEENTNPWRGNVTVTGASADYAVKNIYDLAGNVDEWTMESCQNNYRIMRCR